MKRYIAFCGSSNSGIKTREGAVQWASDLLGQGKNHQVFVTEIIETVERTSPPVVVKPYIAAEDTDESPVRKAA